jgi:hypothetical protein
MNRWKSKHQEDLQFSDSTARLVDRSPWHTGLEGIQLHSQSENYKREKRSYGRDKEKAQFMTVPESSAPCLQGKVTMPSFI